MALALIAAACGQSDSFKVSGSVEGGGSATVELLYCPDGSAKKLSVRAVDGKFMIEGQSRQPALGFVSIGGGAPVAAVIVQNGDNIECKLRPDAPYSSEVKGTKANELLSGFLRENEATFAQGNPAQINPLIAQFVQDNKNSVAAVAAVVAEFRSAGYEVRADSLISAIDPEARPAGMMLNFNSALSAQLSTDARADIIGMSMINRADSVVRYNPYRQTLTLVAFVGADKAMRDSVVPRLKALRANYPARRLAVMEVSTAADSAEWKRSTAADSAAWTQVWTPGTVASPLFRRMAVARVPFFIIADSTGRQLMRASSVGQVEASIRNTLK